MKQNKLTIKINKPISEVFNFTVDPNNTPRWVDFITEESAQGDEIKLGSRYINKNQKGNINIYEVSNFIENYIFELKSIPENYSVRYTYIPISENVTDLEYFEWVESGELEIPFTPNHLNKLKQVLESDEQI